MDLAVMRRRGPPKRPLLRPGWVDPRRSFSRAQVSTSATRLLSDGSTWQEVAADTLRYHGAMQGALLEGQRTNGNRNPRFASASAGTPGSPGTNLTLSQPGSGIAASVSGAGTDAGAAYIDVRVSGTASGAIATTSGLLSFDTTTAISATNGQTWSAAFTARIVAGVFAGTLTQDISERAAGGGAVRQNNTTLSAPNSADVIFSSTATLVGGGTTAGVQHVLRWGCSNGAVVDFTLRIKLPQIEQAAFSSTPILPATTGASTRGADLLSWTLASLGVPASGRCTALVVAVLPQAAPSGLTQALLHVSDGTLNNRVVLRNDAGGANLGLWRVTAGAGSGGTVGVHTPGASVRCGLTIDGTGRVAASIDGGAVSARTGAPTSGLTTIHVGSEISAGHAFGTIPHIDIIPNVALSDTALQAAVAALPTYA